jgi:formylglycine-generating enzyme required for sulfatase activity
VGADMSKANIHSAGLQPVDAFDLFASQYRTLQMIGNAWEYIDEPITPSQRAINEFADKGLQPTPSLNTVWHPMRGGSYRFPELVPDLAFDSTPVPTGWKAPDIGFRCAKDAQ